MSYRYMKIQILDYRDASIASQSAVLAKADAAAREADEHVQRQSKLVMAAKEKFENSIDAAAKCEATNHVRAANEILTNLEAEANAKRSMANEASKALVMARTSNGMCGKFGYQEIDETNPEDCKVVALRDENGNLFPAGEVVGYKIVDPNPPRPSWAQPNNPPKK